MKCPKCQTENPEDSKFCRKCGSSTELDISCPNCGSTHPPDSNFCNTCGHDLKTPKETRTTADSKPTPPFPKPLADKPLPAPTKFEGERKYVTVLFSDMSGYTAMSEKLDPEEIKEITGRIFGEISQIVSKYDGFIEKFIGDAVMAVFGATKAFEDDPIRAIKATREIHRLVKSMSPEYEERIGQPLSMHTGINTGLVVTGEVNLEKGTHGIAGDTINLAARLSSLGKEGDILVGPDTHAQAEGYFDFEALEPAKVKGKSKEIQVYKVLSPKEKPDKIHRLSGFRADLIGRKAEMARLADAVKRLHQEGKGSIISICGGAGTGKSRLVEDFKASLDLEKIQWLEGHAYAYAQNIPYFPMIDLLNRTFQIKEGDSPERVRETVESRIEQLVGKKEEVAPYVGSLYALNYPEVENISAEALKSRLQESIQTIIAALAQRAPTVFFLEDLHWADPSFVESFRQCLLEIENPAIVLCAYRPPFSLFTSHQLPGIAESYHEILLQDLSLSEMQDMLESLLKTHTIPYDLKRVVQEKAEGNPFYLEELINSLIDSRTLVRDNGAWKLTKPLDELDISSTVSGVISSRIDRLENEAKRILQEASVIGRAFLFELLRRVTDLKQDIDRSIRGLEQLDLIRTRTFEPDLEYIFKHALTQEVVYNGLLKKERQAVHERIGLAMEELFHDRLPEFYETLAFHFKESNSIHKAVDYLSKSGEKSFRKSGLEESHRYFKDAFDLLTDKPMRTKEEEHLLIDLLIKWAPLFAYGANWQGLADLFRAHIHIAESLNNKEQLGMFYAWLGYSLGMTGKPRDSYERLLEALRLCEEVGNRKYIGFSCAWLAETCSLLGLLDEAIDFAIRGQEISRQLEWDPILFNEAFIHTAYTRICRGEVKEIEDIGNALQGKGRRYSDLHLSGFGCWTLGVARFLAGDFLSAIELFHQAINITKDPAVSYLSRVFIGWSYLSSDQLLKAERILEELIVLSEDLGGWMIVKKMTQLLLALILISKGDLTKGMRILNDVQRFYLENEYRTIYSDTELMQGMFYFRMIQRAGPKSLSLIAKNIGFLVKNVPFAGKKAEGHFNKAIELSKEIGAKGVLGRAYLYLGLLHKAKNRTSQAKESITEAVKLFEECHADVYLKQAKEALTSLGT